MAEDAGAIVRGHCPNCGADRNAQILAEDTVESESEDGNIWIWGKSTYSILRCLGCDGRYIRHVGICSEDERSVFDPETGEVEYEIREHTTYWPSPPASPIRRDQPPWMWGELEFKYPQFYILLKELYDALNNNLPRLATVGIRIVFDCAAELLGADPNQSFSEKLKELAAGNKIGGEEKEILSTLVDAGSAAAHRGWPPAAPEIETLMSALENFLHRAFVLKYEIREMKKKIPVRSSKAG